MTPKCGNQALWVLVAIITNMKVDVKATAQMLHFLQEHHPLHFTLAYSKVGGATVAPKEPIAIFFKMNNAFFCLSCLNF